MRSKKFDKGQTFKFDVRLQTFLSYQSESDKSFDFILFSISCLR